MSVLHKQQRAFAQRILDGQSGNPFESRTTEAIALKQATEDYFSEVQRFQIYRNNYVIGLREALTGVYPVTRKLVGEEFFRQLARGYLQSYPPRTGNVHDFGDKFADFLAKFAGLDGLPYLPDVARLEWAHHQVFHAQDDGVLNLSTLAGLTENQTTALRFQVSACCRYLTSNYPVLRIWHVHQSDEPMERISLDEGGVNLVVIRHGQHIEIHSLSAGVFTLLDALAKNSAFAQACQLAIARDPECDMAAALHFLVTQKIVTGYSLPSTAQNSLSHPFA